jgi:hypothetical protein
MRYTAAAVVIAVFIPAAALAQTPSAPPPERANQVLSFNPFGLILKWPNFEFERTIGAETTLGFSASHLADLDTSNAAILLRWYPQQTPLEGFYLGARAGAYRFKTKVYEFQPSARSVYHERIGVLPGAGFELGYNWLLGARDNISVGAGFGLTRIIGGGESYDVPSVMPNFRLINVGIAF